MMSQCWVNGMSLSLSSQMWLERVVLWAWILCVNDALCPVNLSLKKLPVSPMYIFVLSAVVMVLLYTRLVV